MYRFRTVAKMLDISNLMIKMTINTQFLSPDAVYGIYLVFKFCDSRIFSRERMYVNLKYTYETETLHSYFATRRDDEWMMIELFRFLNRKKDVSFKFLLESFSRYYCKSYAIYIEGIEFRAIKNASLKIILWFSFYILFCFYYYIMMYVTRISYDVTILTHR
ncbi:putative phloem protein [Helianthus annuus]|nr:putative phloem protein [Helianthus annuus]